MRNVKRLLHSTACLALTLAVSDASARNLSVSTQSIRAAWAPMLFNGEGNFGVRCNVTLEGSFHSRTLPKVANTLVGLITRAAVARPCVAGGTAWAYNGSERNEALGNTTLPNSLPWHLTYESFAGTLPNITRVRFLLSGARFLIRAPTPLGTILCIYTASGANGLASLTATLAAGGRVEELSWREELRIGSETFGCPAARFHNAAALTVLGAATAVTITLV
jgi:hypothetical protein